MVREMKNSNVEWLADIPADWSLRQVGNLATQTKVPNAGLVEKNLLSLSYGNIRRRDISSNEGLLPASYETYNVIEPNDIVLRFTDLQNDQKSLRVGLSKEKGIITSAYTTIRPHDSEDARYIYYALHAFDLRKGFYGMGSGVRQGLKWQEAKCIVIPWPSSSLRERIADYLDAKSAEIDRTIAGAESSIAEYKVYRQSLVCQTALRGINPNGRELRDTGFSSIGSAPSSWQITRGKNVLRLLTRPVRGDDGVITCFRDGEVTLRSSRRTEGFTVSLKEIGYQGIEPGDLVVHSMDGFAGSIGISDSRGKASPVLNVLDSSQNKRYLMYYLRALAYRDVYLALADGIRVRSCNLSWRKIGKLPILVPPPDEQRQIANYLDSRLAAIDRTITAKQYIIDDLKAYKQSLIYEVVTGKREV